MRVVFTISRFISTLISKRQRTGTGMRWKSPDIEDLPKDSHAIMGLLSSTGMLFVFWFTNDSLTIERSRSRSRIVWIVLWSQLLSQRFISCTPSKTYLFFIENGVQRSMNVECIWQWPIFSKPNAWWVQHSFSYRRQHFSFLKQPAILNRNHIINLVFIDSSQRNHRCQDHEDEEIDGGHSFRFQIAFFIYTSSLPFLCRLIPKDISSLSTFGRIADECR